MANPVFAVGFARAYGVRYLSGMTPLTDFVALFSGPGSYQPDTGPVVHTRVEEGGTLRLRNGQIVVFDPLSAWEKEPLAQPVPNGDHRVSLAVVDIQGDERVAAAWVRLATAPVARWEMATRVGEDLSTLRKHGFFGFGVDAGTAAVADVTVAASRAASGEDSLTAALDASYRHTWSHAEESGTPNLVAFSSGMGDGSYASYWGFGSDGAVVALVVDFDLLTEPVVKSVIVPKLTALPMGPIADGELAALGVQVTRVPTKPSLETPGPTFELSDRTLTLTVVDEQGAPIVVDTGKMGNTVAFTGAGRRKLPAGAALRIEVFLGRRAIPRSV